MRPVTRGPVPQLNGTDKTVANYADWRADLLERLGNYCSYCEMVLNDSPQVEHVAPKSVFPARKLEWANMLLGCGPCNRAKSDTECPPTTHFLPDTHNTLLAFDRVTRPVPKHVNRLAGVIVPAAGLGPAQRVKAEATIKLCALDKILVNRRATDMRWHYRWEAMELARRARDNWAQVAATDKRVFLDLLVDLARAKGFFSVWFAAFADVPEVKEALVLRFPGTAATCFDATRGYEPVERITGEL